jgi:hypothetical protein
VVTNFGGLSRLTPIRVTWAAQSRTSTTTRPMVSNPLSLWTRSFLAEIHGCPVLSGRRHAHRLHFVFLLGQLGTRHGATTSRHV